MDKKVIDNIVWYIPFKKLRNSIRILVEEINDSINKINSNTIYNNNEIEYIKNEINNMKNEINYIKYIIDKKYSQENTISPCRVFGMDFIFYHSRTRQVYDYGIRTDVESYNFDAVEFKEGDIVIDIGANIGIVSIYLAKKYPFLKIYAFEPVRQNYECILKNIELNNIKDGIITVENIALTKDRRKLNMIVPIYNTGQSNIHNRYSSPLLSNIDPNIPSIKLDDVFSKYNIEECKLLKIDCEGAEYEILYSTNESNLKKCNTLLAEFHGNIDEQKKLYDYCSKYIQNVFYEENTYEQL